MASSSECLEFKGIVEEWWRTWGEKGADHEGLWLPRLGVCTFKGALEDFLVGKNHNSDYF